jgi:hypothetical protein
MTSHPRHVEPPDNLPWEPWSERRPASAPSPTEPLTEEELKALMALGKVLLKVHERLITEVRRSPGEPDENA